VCFCGSKSLVSSLVLPQVQTGPFKLNGIVNNMGGPRGGDALQTLSMSAVQNLTSSLSSDTR
jgi:hypothetical protein